MNTSRVPTVVLVEDTLDDELLATKGIRNSGVECRLTVQRDGAEALDHLLAIQSKAPSLIILDFKLPKLNGLEILTKLRENQGTRDVPVIIVSGTNGGSVLTDCYRAGANSCVKKPTDPADYIEYFSLITRYWLAINEASDQAASQPQYLGAA